MILRRMYPIEFQDNQVSLFYAVVGMLNEKGFDVRLCAEEGKMRAYVYASKGRLKDLLKLTEGERAFRIGEEPRSIMWELMHAEILSRYGG